MNEQNQNIRPTKKQRELLLFIDEFIKDHGYSPSYREIMAGCDYTSVATVALHVNNLIRRGHLVKRDHSARSLEVVTSLAEKPNSNRDVSNKHEQWFISQIEQRLQELEQGTDVDIKKLLDVEALVTALRVLGYNEAAERCHERAMAIRERSAG